MGLIGYLIYFNTIKSDDFINSPYNTRQDTFADRVVRGKIMSLMEKYLLRQMYPKMEPKSVPIHIIMFLHMS